MMESVPIGVVMMSSLTNQKPGLFNLTLTAGTRGAPGPAGPTGPAGPAGTPGPPNPGMLGYEGFGAGVPPG